MRPKLLLVVLLLMSGSVKAQTSCACCATPAGQPTSLAFQTINSTTVSGTFAQFPVADGYLVIRCTQPSVNENPVHGISYMPGATFANGTVVGNLPAGNFTASGLSVNTLYYFFIYSYKNCPDGRRYRFVQPLTGTVMINGSCTAPSTQPSGLQFTTVTYNSLSGSFTGSGADGYLILVSENSALSLLPSNNTVYAANAVIGNATVVASTTGNSFSATGLGSNSLYYIYVFAFTQLNCSNGPQYLQSAPLSGSQTTISPPATALNYYFGNLHAHSSFSDGNADDETKTPADDYQFAKTALCFDFLGICEHNHAEAGMSLSNWPIGLSQANAATTSTFVGLYGMEWGTISTGGHVVVYGMDSLIGWEPGNYQVFVPKGDYIGSTGLFNVINRNSKAFAYLAHPNNSDFDNLLNISFDSSAFKAVVGSAVENGPAFSTSVNYNDYPSSMSYLSYYRSMLAKGYKVGPSIDHDNHNFTFGKTADTRLVILATSLTRSNLLTSMKNRRFYASQDCSAQISFRIGTAAMGSTITNSASPVINVSSITSAPVSSLKIMYGIPGSGIAAAQLTSSSSGTLNYTDNALTTGATRYYYLDITESNGKRIITSPIWYTRQ